MPGSSRTRVSDTFVKQLQKRKKKVAFSFCPFWNVKDISVKRARAKACGCVGEIRTVSNVQSLEIHMPHNVKAFPFTIYNA